MSALADYVKRISNELVFFDWALLRQNFFILLLVFQCLLYDIFFVFVNAFFN